MKTIPAGLLRISLCMLVMGIISCCSVFAMETADSVLHLDEILVSANSPRKLATVQELSGAELQSLSTTSIADALKYFAGVQIKDYGGLGGLMTVNVRSLGAQHVGVYIDGIRITNAQNGTVDLGKFSLSTLESVSLYNANKLDVCQSASEYTSGATVYMRTRKPTGDSLSVTARLASFHTYMGHVNAQFCHNGCTQHRPPARRLNPQDIRKITIRWGRDSFATATVGLTVSAVCLTHFYCHFVTSVTSKGHKNFLAQDLFY